MWKICVENNVLCHTHTHARAHTHTRTHTHTYIYIYINYVDLLVRGAPCDAVG